MMPVMNGFELLQVLKSDARWKESAGGALAHRGDPPLSARARTPRKPFELEELFAALTAATQPQARV